MFKIDLLEGKYTVIVPDTAAEGKTQKFEALRYGETWRDLTGDGMIMAMARRIKELEDAADVANIMMKADEIFGSK